MLLAVEYRYMYLIILDLTFNLVQQFYHNIDAPKQLRKLIYALNARRPDENSDADKNKKVPDKFLYARKKLHGALHAEGHNINP